MDPRNTDAFERVASEELIRLREENAELEAALARTEAEDAICEWIKYLNEIDERFIAVLAPTLTWKDRQLLDQIRATRNLRVHPALSIREVVDMIPLLPPGRHRLAAVKMLRVLRYFVNRRGQRVHPPPYSLRNLRNLQHRAQQGALTDDTDAPAFAGSRLAAGQAFPVTPTRQPRRGLMRPQHRRAFAAATHPG
jgi:hypothetical protein